MTTEYESILHHIADKLLDFFDDSGAVNYIEQSFESKDDPTKSLVLTVQRRDGLTPCEKLAVAEQRIKELEDMLK